MKREVFIFLDNSTLFLDNSTLSFIERIINLRKRGDLETIKKELIERERQQLLPHPEGSGKTPVVLLGQQNWAEFLLDFKKQGKNSPTVLDIGAGDNCTAWTAPLDDPRLDEKIKLVRQEVPEIYVVGQSGCHPSTNPFINSNVKEFYAGHFVDVLSELLKRKRKFDVILSRFALYQSCAVFDILKMIDDLLAPNGAAFLDQVSRGPANDHVLIFDKDNYDPNPNYYLNKASIYSALTFDKAMIGGLKWTKTSLEGWGAAWRKGQFNGKKMPLLSDVNFFYYSLYNYGYFDFFRLIYLISDYQ
jgi:predicted CopG family antitoxin